MLRYSLEFLVLPIGLFDESQASWFAALIAFGGLFGCPFAGWFVEKAGRKKAILLTGVPFLCGWSLMGLGSAVTVLYLGRFLTGVSSGMVVVIIPMYIAEISPKELRGMLGTGTQLFITVGILLSYMFGLVLSWSSMALLATVIPVAGLLLTMRLPESPRYFLMQGDKQAALRSLAWLRGPLSDIEEECRDIEESLPDATEKFSFSEFGKRELSKPLIVAIGLNMFQQLSGINVVMFYTVSIFQGAGYKENSEMATVLVGAVQVVATIAACLLMDKAGRRVLLFISGLIMAFTCFSMAYYYQQIQLDATHTDDLGWLALASLVIYIIAFSLGMGPIPMLLTSEIIPVKARGPAAGVAMATNWAMSFVVTKAFPSMVTSFGQAGTFSIFGVCCIASVLFVFRAVPETKGKSLEDIELYFLGRAIRGI